MGDVIQQNIELFRKVHPDGVYDAQRTGRMFLMGLFHGAPRHYFYCTLEKYVPGRDGLSVAKKILADEIVLSVFIDFSFVYGVTLLEGQGHAKSLEESQAKFPRIYMWDWILWPPLQALNFLYLPLRFRVLFVSLMNIGWNTILSFFKHN